MLLNTEWSHLRLSGWHGTVGKGRELVRCLGHWWCTLKRGWSPALLASLWQSAWQKSFSEEELSLVQHAGAVMAWEQPMDCSVRRLKMLVTHKKEARPGCHTWRSTLWASCFVYLDSTSSRHLQLRTKWPNGWPLRMWNTSWMVTCLESQQRQSDSQGTQRTQLHVK